MSFWSKAWKGIKGAVKKVARGIKKVAKAVTTALPGGDKLWEFGTKIGKGVMKGIGKITTKLGPIGTMALSFVLAPFLGPAISMLWSGFGAGASALAGWAGTLVQGLGPAGQAIFNGAKFIGGKLGAMGNAIKSGVSTLADKAGSVFGEAGTEFVNNMKAKFSGAPDATTGLTDASGKMIPATPADVLSTTTTGPAPLSLPDGNAFFQPTDVAPRTIAEKTAAALGNPASVTPPSLLDKAVGVAKTGVKAAKTGLEAFNALAPSGGGEVDNSPAAFEVGGTDSVVSSAGQVDPIKAQDNTSFFSELLAQANRKVAGGFS